MNRQAVVGLFTIVALLALFGVFLVIANIGTQGRYKIGVHFKSAAGLHKGALVYESGVTVGLIDATILQPEDFSVDVIVAINNNVDIPRDARFIVAQPLTGDVTLEIVPPAAGRTAGSAVALLPREVLPLDQQPRGTNPPTITDILEEGQGQVQRLDRMLGELETREPVLLDTLQSALTNANALTETSNRQINHLAQELDAMMGTLSVALDTSGRNIRSLTGKLNATVDRNSGQIDTMIAMFSRTSRSLSQTVDSMRDLAGNPEFKQHILDMTKGLAVTTQTFAEIAGDLRTLSSDAQTQAQFRDAVANIDASTQRVNSLLGSLGGRSNVYGVDRGASPAPTGGSRPAGGASPGPNAAAPTPGQVRERIGNAARDLLAIQLRVAQLDRPKPGANSSPILTSDSGPQTDLNVVLLPRGTNSLVVGANDISSPGGTGTWNFVVDQRLGPGLHVGGGFMYSRLGVLGSYTPPGAIGVEGKLYDPRRPTFDAYADYKLYPGLSIFGGERDALRSGRRTVFGLQLQF